MTTFLPRYASALTCAVLTALPMASAQAKTAIEDVLVEACERLRAADQTNLTAGQRLLRSRCIALSSLRENHGEEAFQAALENVSPTQIASQRRSSQQGARMQSRNVGHRVGHLRSQQRPRANGLSLNSHSSPVIGASAGALEVPRWGAFVNGKFNTTSKDATDREPAYDNDATGITVGTDYRITSQLITGLAAGKTDATTEFVSGSGELTSDSTALMMYGTYSLGAWSVSLVAGKSRSDNHTERTIDYVEDPSALTAVSARPSGDADSRDSFVFLSSEYLFESGGWSVGPYLAVESIETVVDEFSESQAEGWGIGYAEQSDRLTRFEAGGRASWAWNQSWGVLTPGISAAWHHYQQSELNAVEARLLFDELQTRTFKLQPDQIDQDFQAVGVDCAVMIAGGISGFAVYEQLLGYEDMSIASVTVGLRSEL